MGDTFVFSPPGGWESLKGLGVTILTIVALLMVIRETLNLIRGRPADFKGVFIRIFIAGTMLAVVPAAASAIGTAALSASNEFLMASNGNLEAAFRKAMSAIKCESDGSVGFFDLTAQFFSLRFWVVALAYIVMVTFLLIKMAVVDVAWKIVFTLVCAQAPLTLSLTAMDELGGLSLYWRNVLGVAIWPITFAMIVAIGSTEFPATIDAMSSGNTTISCTTAQETAEGAVVPPQDNNLFEFAKYMAILCAMGALTLMVPNISATIVGANAAGLLGVGAMAAIAGAPGKGGRLASGAGESLVADRPSGGAGGAYTAHARAEQAAKNKT